MAQVAAGAAAPSSTKAGGMPRTLSTPTHDKGSRSNTNSSISRQKRRFKG